jgi:hypothetical protein
MSLSLIFRLQAAFAALWAIQLIFMPGMMFAMYEWTPSLELVALGQGCGTAMAGLAILAYGIPNWTSEDQLKTAAKSFGIIAILFAIMQLYQILISGMAPGNAMDWVSTLITLLFAVGFFMKSR